jgi:mannose-6-phosphate isomerase-like protein (cupin superfamily)
LVDVRAAHQQSKDWRQVVVDDNLVHAEFVSAAPGTKVPARFHPDTRTWWAVVEGQMRVNIEGQPSFLAGKGTMVQVPMQTVFSMEILGAAPALWYEVNVAGAKTFYPGDVKPPELPGYTFIPVTLRRKPGPWERGNKPHLSLAEVGEHYRAAADRYVGKNFEDRFVEDDRAVVNVVYGTEKNMPPYDPKFRGHFHPESSESMLVLAGKFRAAIEGHEPFVAGEGDVIYIPSMLLHNVRIITSDPSCRFVTSGYRNNSHVTPAAPR